MDMFLVLDCSRIDENIDFCNLKDNEVYYKVFGLIDFNYMIFNYC